MRVPGCILLLAAVLLAGCGAPSTPDGAAPTPPTGAAPGADPSMRGGEIELTHGIDGRLYAGGLGGGSASQALAWASDDQGRSWRALAPPFGDMHAADATSLAQLADGTLVATTLESTPSGGGPGPCVVASASEDGGASWSEPERLCSVHLTDRPWAARHGDGAALIWRTMANTHELARTADGKTWRVTPVPLPPDGGGRLASRGDLLAYATNAPGGLQIASSPGGDRWTLEHVVTTRPVQSLWPPLALGEDDAAAVAWLTLRDANAALEALQGRVGAIDVVAAVRGEGGWEEVVVDPEGMNVHPWTDARGGRIAVTWLHADDPDGDGVAAEDTEWRLRAWVDGEVRESNVTLLRGPIQRGSFGDYLGTLLLDDGTVVALVPAPADDPESGFFDAPLRAIRLPPTGA